IDGDGDGILIDQNAGCESRTSRGRGQEANVATHGDGGAVWICARRSHGARGSVLVDCSASGACTSRAYVHWLRRVDAIFVDDSDIAARVVGHDGKTETREHCDADWSLSDRERALRQGSPGSEIYEGHSSIGIVGDDGNIAVCIYSDAGRQV